MYEIHCVDGPLAGKTRVVKSYTASFRVVDTAKVRCGFQYPELGIYTYQIYQYTERQVYRHRSVFVASCYQYTSSAELKRAADRVIERQVWQPIGRPSILRNFNTWFRLTAYKHTGDPRYLNTDYIVDDEGIHSRRRYPRDMGFVRYSMVA